MSMTLQYNYAQIDLETYQCVACYTCSYEINETDCIPVPYATDDYMDKYYNMNGDQMWYWDAEFIRLWEECPSHEA